MKMNFWRLVLCANVLVSILVFDACVASASPTSQTITLAQFTFGDCTLDGTAGPEQWYPNPGISADDNGNGMASAWHKTACTYLDRVGNDTEHSFCSSNWTVGDFWQFECSSKGASGIQLGFDLVGSPTAPKYFQLLCSTDGSTFFNPNQGFHLGRLFNPFHWFHPAEPYRYTLLTNVNLGGRKNTWSSVFYHANTHYTADLSSCTALNHAQEIYFRLVDTSCVSIAYGTVGPTGTARVDNFSVNGTAYSPNAQVILAKSPRLTYGRALDNHQLNARASMPGTFKYIPPAGSVPNAGTNILTAIFTPSDAKYSPVTNTVSLVVVPAPLTVSAFNATRTVGTTNPVFSGGVCGLVNGDRITATYNCSATNSDAPGYYSIVPALDDPDRRLANYTVTTKNGTLTVSSEPAMEGVLAQWNFGTPPSSVALAGGVWYSNIAADTGSGTATGWHKRPSTYSGMSNGTNYALSVTNWNEGDFWQFSTSYKGAKDLSVAWDQLSSGAGPRRFQLKVSSDGINYSTVPQDLYMADNATDNPCMDMPATDSIVVVPINSTRPINSFSYHYVNLSGQPDVNEETNIWVRLVDVSPAGAGGGRAGPIGLSTIYNFTIYGVVTPPVVSWTPQPMAYGTPLGPGQLNASANTSGTFSHEPNAGTILPAGKNTLSVVFVPSDSNYHAITNSVSFMVAPRPMLSLSR